MENSEIFTTMLLSVKRKGIEKFTDWLVRDTDFMKAPASTRFHGNCEGGLLKHSLSVCRNMMCIDKSDNYDSKVIVSLLHDICKVNFYTVSERNVKNSDGVWVKEPFYKIDEQYPFGGHGSKSVYLIMKHGLELTDEEAAAINCHMGGWDVTPYHNPSQAYDKYQLAVYLHIADMMASYLDKN